MIPTLDPHAVTDRPSPRTRGDDPVNPPASDTDTGFSPHPRG